MIIKSLIDTDLYKLTMQYAVLSNFPNAYVKYELFKRSTHKFPEGFVERLREEINKMKGLQLISDERSFLEKNCPFLDPPYLDFLEGYEFDPNEVAVHQENGELSVEVEGYWYRTILWEVPILAIVTELYYEYNLDDIVEDDGVDIIDADYIADKISISLLDKNNPNLVFADFGTRRRMSYQHHSDMINHLKFYSGDNFIGTSNVHLAHVYDVKPIGTFAHEWVSGIAALKGYTHPNYHAMEYWVKTYNGNLGIALTDTFGTSEFFDDFDMKYSKLFDGVRHDSGDPYEFADKVINHYKSMGVDPMSKTIIFSDNINGETANAIYEYCEDRIKVGFGIGTYITNNPECRNSESMNVVMKLTKISMSPNSKPHSVIKLSDEPGKETGDKDTVKLVKWYLDE